MEGRCYPQNNGEGDNEGVVKNEGVIKEIAEAADKLEEAKDILLFLIACCNELGEGKEINGMKVILTEALKRMEISLTSLDAVKEHMSVIPQ